MSADTMTDGAARAAAAKIEEDTVYLDLRLSMFGARVKMADDDYETDADKKMVHAAKDILESKELTAIYRFDSQTRGTLRRMYALPSPELRGGMYRITVPAIPLVEEFLKERQQTRRGLVRVFMEKYRDPGPEGLIAKAKAKLKSTWDASEYPDPEDVEATFGWEQDYISYATPTSLRKVSSQFFQAEWEKQNRKCEQAAEQIIVLMRAQAQGLVAHLVDKLRPTEDGKRKTFYATNVSKLSDFLGTLEARNVLGDEELSKLMGRVKKLIDGVDVEDLKKQEGLRSSVLKGMEEVKAGLDALVQSGGRKMKL